jgi:hypothetical protein
MSFPRRGHPPARAFPAAGEILAPFYSRQAKGLRLQPFLSRQKKHLLLHRIAQNSPHNWRVGDRRARKSAVFTGAGLILLIAKALVPWMNPSSVAQCYWIGLLAIGIGHLFVAPLIAAKIHGLV